jgi:mono/diheme cytochrome c family protein
MEEDAPVRNASSLLFLAIAPLFFSAAGNSQLVAPLQPTATPTSQTGGGAPKRPQPAPTNLKVLPKDLTGDQVHEIMEQWEAALGTHCATCHTADPNNIGPNGRPRLNYADDSKPEKSTARLMFKMTDVINRNYVGTIESSGAPVTCGTCHRGHLGPEPFVAPPDKHDSTHAPQSQEKSPSSDSSNPTVK